MRSRVIIAIAISLAGAAVATRSAHADATCTTLIGNVRNQLIAHGGAYNFDLTFHRTDIDEVEYSRGAMNLYSSTGYWALTGGSTNQLFRDRYNGNQPFNIGAADTITPYISTDGQLYIWYNTWVFVGHTSFRAPTPYATVLDRRGVPLWLQGAKQPNDLRAQPHGPPRDGAHPQRVRQDHPLSHIP